MGSVGRKVEKKAKRFVKGSTAKMAKYSDLGNLWGGRDYHDRVYDQREREWKQRQLDNLAKEQAKENQQTQSLTAEDGTQYGQPESSNTLYRPDNIPQGSGMYATALRNLYNTLPERGTELQGQPQPSTQGVTQRVPNALLPTTGPVYDSPATPEGTPPAQPMFSNPLVETFYSDPANAGQTYNPRLRDFSGRSGNPFAQAARDAGFTDFQDAAPEEPMQQPDIRRIPVKIGTTAPRGNRLWMNDPRNVNRLAKEAAERARAGVQGNTGTQQNEIPQSQLDAMRNYARRVGPISGGARQMVAPNMSGRNIPTRLGSMAKQSETSAALRGGGNNG